MMEPLDYKTIFIGIESSLRNHQGLNVNEFQLKYEAFTNFEFKKRPDQEYFDLLKMIVFYSGFKADTVSKKESIINQYFGDFSIVAKYGDSKITEILSDEKMIKNRLKVNAVVNNAKKFMQIIEKHGSFHNYLQSFSPNESFENLMLLKEELEYQFEFLGGITGYHFLMDIGLEAIKPDRVITRIFERLGLIESDKQLLKTIFHGRKFAGATGHPIRYIDIIFVTYGQQGDKNTAENGICLEKNPKCEICGITNFCISPLRNKAFNNKL